MEKDVKIPTNYGAPSFTPSGQTNAPRDSHPFTARDSRSINISPTANGWMVTPGDNFAGYTSQAFHVFVDTDSLLAFIQEWAEKSDAQPTIRTPLF